MSMMLVGFISMVVFTVMSNRQQTALAENNTKLEHLNVKLIGSVAEESRLNEQLIVRESAIKQNLYASQMLLATEASSEPGGMGRVKQLVDNWRDSETVPGWEWENLDHLGKQELNTFDVKASVDDVYFVPGTNQAKLFCSAQSRIISVDIETGTTIDSETLPGNVKAIEYSPDFKLLAMGLNNGTVVVRPVDPEDDSEFIKFTGHKSRITDLRWNVGGDLLASCDQSGILHVWDWYQRKRIASGEDVLHQSGKRHLAWSFDGMHIAWTSGTEIRQLTATIGEAESLVKDDWATSPCWSHEGKLLAFIGPANTIVIRDTTTGRDETLSGHQLFIESLEWHPKRHFLVSASGDGSVRVWNADTFKEVRSLRGHTGQVSTAAWSNDGRKIVSGGLPEDKVRVWDVSDLGKEAFDRELNSRPAIAWHPDSQRLAVAEGDDILLQDDQGKSKWLRAEQGQSADIHSLSYSHDGKRIACVSGKGRIWTVSTDSGKLLKVMQEGGDSYIYPETSPKGVAWSAADEFLAGIGPDGKVHAWHVASGEDVSKKMANRGQSTVLAWAPNSMRLAYAGTDNEIHLYDAAKRKRIDDFTLHGWKSALAWSPDGDRLAVNDRRTILVWDVESGTILKTCEGPSAMVTDLSWSSSQNRIAALTQDGQICLWNTRTWDFTASYRLHGPLLMRSHGARTASDWFPPPGTGELLNKKSHGNRIHRSLGKRVPVGHVAGVDLKRIGRETLSPIKTIGVDRQHDIGMHGVGHDQDFNAVRRWLKIVIDRNQAEQVDDDVKKKRKEQHFENPP